MIGTRDGFDGELNGTTMSRRTVTVCSECGRLGSEPKRGEASDGARWCDEMIAIYVKVSVSGFASARLCKYLVRTDVGWSVLVSGKRFSYMLVGSVNTGI